MPNTALTLAQCEAYYHLPVADAAQRLGVSRPTISKILRRHGVRRWPYRKLQAQRKRAQHPSSSNRRDASPSDRVIHRPMRQASNHRRNHSPSSSRLPLRPLSPNRLPPSIASTPQSQSARYISHHTHAHHLTVTPSSPNHNNTRSPVSIPSHSTRPVRPVTQARSTTPTASEHLSHSFRIHTPPSSCPSSRLSSRPSSPQHSPPHPPRVASPTPSEQCLPWPPCDLWAPPRPSSAKAVFGEAWTRGLFIEGNDGTHFQFLAPTEHACMPRLSSSTSLHQECYEEFTPTKENEHFAIHFGDIDECTFGGIQF